MAQPLSNLAAGSLLKLNETVSGVTTVAPFLVLAHNHHAAGRTTLCRNYLWPTAMAHGSIVYGSSAVKTWLEQTYVTYLDGAIQSKILPVSIGYYQGPGSCKVFLLSAVEISGTTTESYTGPNTRIPYFSNATLLRAYRAGSTSASTWQTRSTFYDGGSYEGFYINTSGVLAESASTTSSRYVRPALTLPTTLSVSSATDADGCYTVEAGVNTPVKVSGAWYDGEPKAKIGGTWYDGQPSVKAGGVWYDAA